jgi:hypothetical protein
MSGRVGVVGTRAFATATLRRLRLRNGSTVVVGCGTSRRSVPYGRTLKKTMLPGLPTSTRPSRMRIDIYLLTCG